MYQLNLILMSKCKGVNKSKTSLEFAAFRIKMKQLFFSQMIIAARYRMTKFVRLLLKFKEYSDRK